MNQFEPSLLATDAAVRERLLAALREVGTLTGACRRARVARSTLYRLRRTDRDFDTACATAVGRATNDALEAAVIDRATFGVERVRTYANGTVERWRVFDNALAFKLLGKLMPRKYGDNAVAAEPERPVMTRAEFIAAIRMRPRLEDVPDDGE